LVALVALGGFAVSRLIVVEGISATIVGDNLPGMALAGDLQKSAFKNLTLALEHALAPDTAKKADIEKQIEAVSAQNNETAAAYEKTITTEADRTAFA